MLLVFGASIVLQGRAGTRRSRLVCPLSLGAFVVDRHCHAVMLGFFKTRRKPIATERIQRRLAAILVVDVVGYSRFDGCDEAGTLVELSALRRELIDPKIAEHGAPVPSSLWVTARWSSSPAW